MKHFNVCNLNCLFSSNFKSFYTLFFALCLAMPALAQQPAHLFAKQIGGTGSSDLSTSIAQDAAGNIYVAGSFDGVTDFDTDTVGTYNLTSVGSDINAYISKYNANGAFVWALHMKGPSEVESIKIDPAGNIFASGIFIDTVDFDPGIDTFNLISQNVNTFIIKLNAAGDFIWAKRLGSDSGIVYNLSLNLDNAENAIVTGYYIGFSDFNPDSTALDTSTAYSADAYVCKLNASGNFVWAKRFGGNNTDAGLGVASDNSGNIYVTGQFGDTVDFNPDTASADLLAADVIDAFILKLNAAGNYVWAKKIGGTSSDFGYTITVDVNNEVIAAGLFQDTADFNPDTAGVYNLTSAGSDDIFIVKLTNAGNFKWASQLGGIGIDFVHNITTDAYGEIYSTGYFRNTADFNPDTIGTFNLTSAGSNDAFVSKLDAGGNFKWAIQSGGTLNDASRALVVGNGGDVSVTGTFNLQSEFDFDAGGDTLTSFGGVDIFIHKIGQPTFDIKAQKQNIQVLVYPNPANANVNIVFNKPQTGKVILYDVSGRMINAMQLQKTQQIQLPVSSLTAGIYLLRIQTANGITSRKVVIR